MSHSQRAVCPEATGAHERLIETSALPFLAEVAEEDTSYSALTNGVSPQVVILEPVDDKEECQLPYGRSPFLDRDPEKIRDPGLRWPESELKQLSLEATIGRLDTLWINKYRYEETDEALTVSMERDILHMLKQTHDDSAEDEDAVLDVADVVEKYDRLFFNQATADEAIDWSDFPADVATKRDQYQTCLEVALMWVVAHLDYRRLVDSATGFSYVKPIDAPASPAATTPATATAAGVTAPARTAGG